MFREFLQAAVLVILAEMGDKSQFMAMGFACQYRKRHVMIGAFLAIAVNHGLAIVLGTYLTRLIPLSVIQMLAAISFLGFGLWTLLETEANETESIGRKKNGPIATVAMTIFLGEFGDKTQLMAASLAATAIHPTHIFMGTVSGMMVTTAFGVYIGSLFRDNMPKKLIKNISGVIFLLFGVLHFIHLFELHHWFHFL